MTSLLTVMTSLPKATTSSTKAMTSLPKAMTLQPKVMTSLTMITTLTTQLTSCIRHGVILVTNLDLELISPKSIKATRLTQENSKKKNLVRENAVICPLGHITNLHIVSTTSEDRYENIANAAELLMQLNISTDL